MDRTAASPPVWRIVSAFIVAPLIAATAMASFEPMVAGPTRSVSESIFESMMLYCLFGAYPATILFGVPAFLCLRHRVRPTALNCSLAGAFVSAMPWLILILLQPNNSSGSVNGHVTVSWGHITLWGWTLYAEYISEIGAFGLLGGLAFWLIGAAGTKSEAVAPG